MCTPLALRVFSTLLLVIIPAPSAGSDEPAAVTLSLGQAGARAAANNPSAEQARLQWLIRLSQERAAWGDFEPALVSSIAQSSLHRLNTALEQQSQLGRPEYSEQKTEYQLGVEGRFLTGADYHLGYTLTRTESDLIVGSEYESFLGLSVNQPLMRGATRQAPLFALRLSRLDSLVAFHTYRKQLISAVAEAEAAYWDLVLAQELRGAAAESVDIARELAEDSRQRRALGKGSDLDVSEAETQLDIRNAELGQRELDIVEAAARLRLLLGGGGPAEEGSLATADPLDLGSWTEEGFNASKGSLADQALLLAPDVGIRKAELEKEVLQQEYQRDQRLPQLTAKANYGFQGLGDSPDTSLERLQGQGFPTWSIGLDLRLPLLGDVHAAGLLEQEQLKRQIAARMLQAAERETVLSVKALIQRVGSYGRQAVSARTVTGYRRKLLEVERARMAEGQSDIRRMYDLEQGLSDARRRELESYNRFRKSMIDLAAAGGTILMDGGLEFIDGGRIQLAPPLGKAK
jgi:outer membrane protein TolC